MRRLIGVLVLAGGLFFAGTVPNAAAQSYGPGLGPLTWYGPFAAGPLSGPYGGIGATGFGSTGFGCGQGAYGFSNYGYGVGLGLGPMMPTCGGFGNWPYLYPYTTGYPYASGTTPFGALALSGLGNSMNPFFTGTCDGLLTGSTLAGQPNTLFAGAAGQFSLGNNLNLLNLSSPVLNTFSQFGTLGGQNVFGCVGLR